MIAHLLAVFCIYITFFFLPEKFVEFDLHLTSPEMLRKDLEADLSPCFTDMASETQRIFPESHKSHHCKYGCKTAFTQPRCLATNE